MTNLEQNIVDCLRYFGPCTVGTIQQKLDLRGIEVNQMTILNACEHMLMFEQIRIATGFNKFNPGYKL
jgi:hypothetical protein